MPVSAPGSQPSRPNECGGDRERLFGKFRDLRQHVQDVGASLERVRRALELSDPTARAYELPRSIQDVTDAANRNEPEIDAILKACDSIFDACPALYDQMGDHATRIRQTWFRLRSALPGQQRTAAVAEADARAAYDEAKPLVAAIELAVARLTVESRLNQRLEKVRIGRKLDFNGMFADEIPDPAQRRAILVELKGQPDAVSGEVDAEQGVIYKASQNTWRRLLSPAMVLAVAFVGGIGLPNLLVNGFTQIGLPAGWLLPSDITVARLQTAYWPLLVGSFGHVLVGAVNEQKRHSADAFLALDDWFSWIHVRELALVASVFVVWFTLIGLAFTLGDAALQPQAAFFTGYSIDSVSGTFINRFDTLAQTSSESILAKLRPSNASTT
jgi:hypothetical protein